MKRVWTFSHRLRFLLPAIISLLLGWILSFFPEVTEYVFSRGLYRLVSVPLGWLTSWLPFSLTEWLVILALPLAILLVVWFIRKRKRALSKPAFTRCVLGTVGWVLSGAVALYMLMHGFNFHRLPVAELMELNTDQKDAAFLQQVCMDLAKTASAARQELTTDQQGRITDNRSTHEILAQANQGFEAAAEDYPFLWGGTWQPKSVMLSPYWSYTGITGMYLPFWAEANVNTDQPLFAYPATAAHELAHTRGFSREDECNFLMFLTCRYNEDPLYRYAGAFLAYIHCENALYAYDEELVWEVRDTACSAGMLQDIGEQSDYWDRFKGPVKEVSTGVNNAFLTVQGEEDGVLSYNRVVELILAYYDTVVWGE